MNTESAQFSRPTLTSHRHLEIFSDTNLETILPSADLALTFTLHNPGLSPFTDVPLTWQNFLKEEAILNEILELFEMFNFANFTIDAPETGFLTLIAKVLVAA